MFGLGLHFGEIWNVSTACTNKFYCRWWCWWRWSDLRCMITHTHMQQEWKKKKNKQTETSWPIERREKRFRLVVRVESLCGVCVKFTFKLEYSDTQRCDHDERKQNISISYHQYGISMTTLYKWFWFHIFIYFILFLFLIEFFFMN